MDWEALFGSYEEVLRGNDVTALKTALQNLMVLFEAQNRGYLEMKDQVKTMRFGKQGLTLDRCDIVSIGGEESRPECEGIVDEAFQLLAAMRVARKAQNEVIEEVSGAIDELQDQEKRRTERSLEALNKSGEEM
jgi:hypothetical protein